MQTCVKLSSKELISTALITKVQDSRGPTSVFNGNIYESVIHRVDIGCLDNRLCKKNEEKYVLLL